MSKKATKKLPKPRLKKTHTKVKGSDGQKSAAQDAKSLRQAIKNKRKPRGKRKVGRPTVLTVEIIDAITGFIYAGAYIETACAAAGLPKSLYYEWLKLGAKRKKATDDDKKLIDPLYEQFTDAIKKAVVDAELKDLIRVDKAAERTWQAAAWKLERKYPSRWSRTQRLQHEGEIAKPDAVPEPASATREQLIRILRDPKARDAAEKVLEVMNEAEDDGE